MHTADELTGLYLALEEMPGDPVTLLVLADYYSELGEPEASACLRWIVAHGRHPFRFRRGLLTMQSAAWTEDWYWWAIDDVSWGRNWGHPLECRLPPRLWRLLRHSFDYTPAVFKQYPTVRQAYEALLEAWPLAPLSERGLTRREVRHEGAAQTPADRTRIRGSLRGRNP
ncbi:MAG: hypothetical protein U0840_09905 [Gemmataceae bacterium]